MNSEIKLRGKSIETEYSSINNEWIYGDLFHDKDCFGHITASYIYEYDNAHGRCFQFEVDPNTVGQYIGLKDKNSIEIYEGDIVTFGRNQYQIIYECGGFCLYEKYGNMITNIGGINDHCYSLVNLYLECCWEEESAFDLEVIGTIHDNKEEK